MPFSVAVRDQSVVIKVRIWSMSPNGNAVSVDQEDSGRKKLSNGYSGVDTHLKLPKEIGTDYSFKRQIVWPNAIGFLMLHLAGLVGLLMCGRAHIFTIWWSKCFFLAFKNAQDSSSFVLI